jgi:CRISPR system Cascade subunit CasB
MSEAQAKERGTGPEEVFVEALGRLDTGEKARLKRNAGFTLAEARDVLGVFYRLLPPTVSRAQYEDYFLVATLYPLAEGSGRHRDLGATLRAARSDTNAKGIDRRVEALLDAEGEQLRFRLRQAIRFAQSSRVTVNWPQLLRDVLRWDHPARFVQQRWAESYFAVTLPARREDSRARAAAAASDR